MFENDFKKGLKCFLVFEIFYYSSVEMVKNVFKNYYQTHSKTLEVIFRKTLMRYFFKKKTL